MSSLRLFFLCWKISPKIKKTLSHSLRPWSSLILSSPFFPPLFWLKLLTSTMHHHMKRKKKTSRDRLLQNKNRVRHRTNSLQDCWLQDLQRSYQTVQLTKHGYAEIHFLWETYKHMQKGKTIAEGFRGIRASSSALGCKVSTYIWAKLCNVACWPHLSVWLITATREASN